MTLWKRRRLFVDSEVQGAFLLRAMVYWTTCIVTVALLLYAWQGMRAILGNVDPEHNDLWSYLMPVGLLVVFLLPIFAYDLVKLSNALVGPVLRLRRTLRQLIAGEQVEPIKFRSGDFWQSFAAEFNALAQRIEQLELERDQAIAALKEATAEIDTEQHLQMTASH